MSFFCKLNENMANNIIPSAYNYKLHLSESKYVTNITMARPSGQETCCHVGRHIFKPKLTESISLFFFNSSELFFDW